MGRALTISADDIEIPKRLLSDGSLSVNDVEEVRAVATATGQPIRMVLDRLGLVSQARWAEIVAEEAGLPLVVADALPSILPRDDRLSLDYMRRSGIALIEGEDPGPGPMFAIANPMAKGVRQALTMIYGDPIRYVVATGRDIESALDRAEIQMSDPAAADRIGDAVPGGDDLDTDRLTELANNAPTVTYLDDLFTQAVEANATDIHIEMLEGGPRVRLRLDGQLVEIEPMRRGLYEGAVSRLKILAGMDISERRLPQDGRIRQRSAGRQIDIRVASAPTVQGETLVLRLLDNSQERATLAGLNLPARVEARFRKAIRDPNGLILMTGPTGSGKTTTLHALLSELNETGQKIITIENPVEIQTPGLVQIEVKPDLGWTFAAALRSVLRHDPNILMVGEIRDPETAELAVRAAMTGHLVLSTLHTNRAHEAALRLGDMGVPDYLLGSVLRLVGAQRLVRTLCDCAEPATPATHPKLYQALEPLAAIDPTLGQLADWSPRQAVGCTACNNTGFRGRAALFEVSEDGQRAGRSMGLEGLELVARGRTTTTELVRVFGAGRFWE